MSEELNDPAAEEMTPAPVLVEESDEEGGYRITLPSFEGPLDLLLHLIRKHEIDIFDIPIVFITEQYRAYLDAMEQLDLEIAADYVYMAAVLIHVKSRMLLPRRDEEGGVEEDPRQELVDRLLEYQRFKSVAESFAEIDLLRIGIWPRPPSPQPDSEVAEIDMSEVSLFDIVDAFQTALRRYRSEHPEPIRLKRLAHRVSDKMRELYTLLGEKSPMRLLWYLEGRDRGELVAIFLGLLELVRLGGISLRQGNTFGDILVHRTEADIDTATFLVYDN